MVDAVLADRPEERFGEAAVSAIAENEEICVALFGDVQQCSGRMPLCDFFADCDLGIAHDFLDNFAEFLRGGVDDAL